MVGTSFFPQLGTLYLGIAVHLTSTEVVYVAFGVEQISQTGARGFVFVYVQAGHVHGPSAVDEEEVDEEEEEEGGEEEEEEEEEEDKEDKDDGASCGRS